MNHDHLFAFEDDFVTSLRCIPMAVRLKLDRCGLKLSLRQWTGLTTHDRQALLTRPCEATNRSKDTYREWLEFLVHERTGDRVSPLPDPVLPVWESVDGPPWPVRDFATRTGLRPPDPDEWRGLSELQRFALVKLSRDNHDNVNFAPALREFGIG